MNPDSTIAESGIQGLPVYPKVYTGLGWVSGDTLALGKAIFADAPLCEQWVLK